MLVGTASTERNPDTAILVCHAVYVGEFAVYPWFKLASNAAFLMRDAQQVMALRLTRVASGGPQASREMTTMVSEKASACVAAQTAGMAAVFAGKTAPAVAEQMMRVYKKRVWANRRRLSKP